MIGWRAPRPLDFLAIHRGHELLSHLRIYQGATSTKLCILASMSATLYSKAKVRLKLGRIAVAELWLARTPADRLPRPLKFTCLRTCGTLH